MAKSKAEQEKKLLMIISVLLFCSVFVVLLSMLIRSFKPFYKVEDRAEQVQREAKKRSDLVEGWIKVQGTNIDYPIIYNDYYKGTDLNNIKYDFAWSNEKVDKLTNRPLIVGHNLLNVSKTPLIADPNHSRFEQLMSFVYIDFVKDNKYIQYTIDGKNYLYKIFSISFVNDSTIDYETVSMTEEELEKYINSSIKDSMFDFDIDVSKEDKIITLVTCTRMFGYDSGKTFKIDARMVRDKESIRNYKVKEKKKYKKIKKVMEGDSEDEQDI